MDKGQLFLLVLFLCGAGGYWSGQQRARSLGVPDNWWVIWGTILGVFVVGPILSFVLGLV